MNKISLFAAALFFTSLAQAEPTKVKLWPDGAPGAKGTEDKDQPFILSINLQLFSADKGGTA
mgnify:CR=1 FL=1